MAITITVNDANKDGKGIDFAAYLKAYDETYVADGRGGFSSEPVGGPNGIEYRAKQYASYDKSDYGVVLLAGARELNYSMSTHTIVGSIAGLRFGNAITLNAAAETFEMALDLQITGLAIADDTAVHNFVVDITGGKETEGGATATLLDQLKGQSVTFVGSTGADVFTGFDKADKISGGGGNDRLGGGGGNDTLDGGAGADRMEGGSGDDTYVVDNARDAAVEKAGEGTDLVKASVSHTLSDNVEKLTLTGTARINATGNNLANVLNGNDANNVLDGKGGADRMAGGKGNDSYVVDNAGDVVVERAGEGTDLVKASVSYTLSGNVENLALTGATRINATGNNLANLLNGNAANNVLDGKGGADRMAGGKGNDTYVVDNAGDVVVERANEGTDLVKASISHTLSNHVENLTLTGTARINATGNSLANVLNGNDANNVLDGKGGADRMAGGKGNDSYVVDNAGDAVVERADGGIDLVRASVSHTLSNHVENLTLTGTARINATGNNLANVVIGNGAGNVLDGGAGDDVLTGGAGSDTFVFKAGQGHDRVTDFASGSDAVQFDKAVLADFAAVLAQAEDVSAGVLIGYGASSVLLSGLVKAELQAGDFLFA